ncbi:tyrosine-type recombinase/integrase [Streptosporangium roseum]|uniref:tyrosine-type recombinase/integrase n=1 Tax=Streptosporangium roseum TaxID=2001 RepID=UPI000AA7CB70|nr:tyrosine-type recombinase/integrase [Streptosporangium roseum]
MNLVIAEQFGRDHPFARHLHGFLTDQKAVAADVTRVLNSICSRRPRKDVPLDRLRDRVLFETIYMCGSRAAEACGLDIEDFDLRQDDEHLRIHGKGGTVRTVLLDDRGYVALLKLYLARIGYHFGPAFRASINGTGGPLSYDAAHHRWENYCEAAGVEIDIHQLRHAHATELINVGVSIEVVRCRLGRASTETTQLYTLLADAEIRAARRRCDRRRAIPTQDQSQRQRLSAGSSTPKVPGPRSGQVRSGVGQDTTETGNQ